MRSRQSDSSAYALRGSKVVEWVKIEPGAENSWTVKTCLMGSYNRRVLDILQLDSIFKLERIWEQSPARCSQQEAVSTAVERFGDRAHSVLPEKTPSFSSAASHFCRAEISPALSTPVPTWLTGQTGQSLFFFSQCHAACGVLPNQGWNLPPHAHTHTHTHDLTNKNKVHKILEGFGYVYHLDSGDDIIIVCICPNSSNCTQ